MTALHPSGDALPGSARPAAVAPTASSSAPDRRAFLSASAATMATATVTVTGLAGASEKDSPAESKTAAVHTQGSQTVKVALIGCGGRGTSAAINAAEADENVEIAYLADVFPDRIEGAKKSLVRRLGKKFTATDETCFDGFDSYKKVMESDADLVLLCTTPHFRPAHLAAAVEAGKHIFCEKPVAVDAPGVRSVMDSVAKAKEKNLILVSGLCWRYDLGLKETVDRILDGAIGDVVAVQANYLTGTLWHRGRQPDWSEMEYQMRNWLYYTWLSGDHIAEQHIHSLDKAMWLLGDVCPDKCFGIGGREVRTDEAMWGNVYDHFTCCYEWDHGGKAFSYTRQMAGCYMNTEDYVLGTKGRANLIAHTITPTEGEPWKYSGPRDSMYDVEHRELFKALREGRVINNGDYMADSTLMAIMGREAAYTGKLVTKSEMLASNVVLGPTEYAWGDVPPSRVAQPGSTAFS